MTKIDIDVDNVNGVCLNHLARVNHNVSSALNSLHSVDLPFYCGSLNNSIDSLNGANNGIRAVEKKLRSASEFVNRNENEITTELDKIACWKFPV